VYLKKYNFRTVRILYKVICAWAATLRRHSFTSTSLPLLNPLCRRNRQHRMTAEAQLCAFAVVAQFAMRAAAPSISRPSTAIWHAGVSGRGGGLIYCALMSAS